MSLAAFNNEDASFAGGSPPRVVKPMLAKDASYDKDGKLAVTYPVIVQPKLDGIRCLIVDGVARSRTFKPIPNAEIQAALGCPEFEGLDGEIIVGDPTAEGCMQTTSSFVMAPGKTGADWTFYVFDKWDASDGFTERYEAAVQAIAAYDGDVAFVVSNFLAVDEGMLDHFEQGALADGHEGIILRDPSAVYKHGRSGKKGPLLKLKRFIDFEAEVIGVYEEQENTNEATRDAFGRTERSTKKAGKVGKGCLGGFELRAINGPHKGDEFRCGTGFKRPQRQELWDLQEDALKDPAESGLIGRTVKIKSFPIGVKDLPRFPVFLEFLGFRDMEIDG